MLTVQRLLSITLITITADIVTSQEDIPIKEHQGPQTCGGILKGPVGIIQTPNFPNPFPVPIKCRWIIEHDIVNGTISIYFTQQYTTSGLTFTEYMYYDESYKLGERKALSVTEENITRIKWLQTTSYKTSHSAVALGGPRPYSAALSGNSNGVSEARRHGAGAGRGRDATRCIRISNIVTKQTAGREHVAPDGTLLLHLFIEMDIESIEKLIEIVRRHAFLFDMDHEQYKNASLKLATWETIGRELNYSGEVVRNKWKTIRDGYTKYKKQLKKSTGSSKKNVTYTWASQLSFLDNFNEPRPSCSNVLLKAIKRSPRSQTPTLDSDHSQDIPSTSSSSQVLPPESSASTSAASTARISSLKNKRSLENDDDERESQFLNAKKKKELDVIDNLFLSYADTFKKFPAREQAIVKLELAKLFANTELQLLNNGVTFKSERSATD